MKTNQARMWLLAWISGTNLSNTSNLPAKCIIACNQLLPNPVPEPGHPLKEVKSQARPEKFTWAGSNTGCAEWKQSKANEILLGQLSVL